MLDFFFLLKLPDFSLKSIISIIERGCWYGYDISIGTLKPEQNGRHFADIIFKYVSWKETTGLFIQILWKLIRSTWQNVSIGSGYSLMPTWWQAITWTIDDPVHCILFALLGLNVLIGSVGSKIPSNLWHHKPINEKWFTLENIIYK